MPVVSEMVHPAGLGFAMQRKAFVARHVQKKPWKEFASTPGGQLSYCRDLFAVPCVVTVNYTTKNLNFLETNDWLRLPVNRVLVKFPPPEHVPGRMED